jgi:hypothetical protein
MKMNRTLAAAIFGFVFAFIPDGQADDMHRHSARLAANRDLSIEDLRTDLDGSNWQAVAPQSLRPGLAPILTFTAASVAPEGYHYDVNSANTLTVHFDHGDTQQMRLTPDGRFLSVVFHEHMFVYQLLPQPDDAGLDLQTELAGTKWNALPGHHLRPGLPATLTFAADTVAPAGYHYDVNSSDSLTIHFNHGDTQLMLLGADGKRLKFLFKNQGYEYRLAPH